MKAKDFVSETTPWVEITRWKNWCQSKCVSVTHGSSHNKTDGGVHYILQCGNAIYEMYANYWDYRAGWQEAVDWVETTTDGEE